MVLYAQGATAGEVTITLKLTGGAKMIGPIIGKLTSVEATLQIGKKRTSPVVDPALLTEAEKVIPAALSTYRMPGTRISGRCWLSNRPSRHRLRARWC